ncbi:2,6-dihydroxypyridine 3-hydroxylase subunit NdhA [Paenarthrobacter sp. YIM B13468]|uniref:2,6-dihydroxypyridine 3-hydroxylase subunit NdhA n=1 Tax=Paenarthrobacter sp. YIM B13468 TaxID=3366295 RepID=UPI00366E8CA2
MKLPAISYTSPTSMEEACAMLSADDDSKVIAGGQSLLPVMAMRLAQPTVVVDLAKIPGLAALEEVGDYVRFGPMVTHATIVSSPLVANLLPMMSSAGKHIAHPQIRNRGTLGGSLAHGDAAGEWPLVLLALDGMVEVQSVRGKRTIDADALFVGPYMTSISSDEIITDIWMPSRPRGWAYGEFSRRSGDYGLANVAITLATEDSGVADARIAVGGAVGKIQRVPGAEDLLRGSKVAADLAERASIAGAESLTYISDMHGSAEYRRGLVQELIRRTILEAGART